MDRTPRIIKRLTAKHERNRSGCQSPDAKKQPRDSKCFQEVVQHVAKITKILRTQMDILETLRKKTTEWIFNKD